LVGRLSFAGQCNKDPLGMIGVIANPAEHVVVREFFELFKTPWEFYRPGQKYEVLLCAGDANFEQNAAKVVLIYAGQKLSFDLGERIQIASQGSTGCGLLYKGYRIPIYGDRIVFRGDGTGELLDQESKLPAIHLSRSPGRVVVRVGYNLFAEVHTMLTAGQPASNASIPTLELHIALMRDLIVAGGVALVEIPPVPDGYRFIACLTHDVDHPLLRNHWFDHTMFGFLYRATLGSLIGVLRGRRSARELLRNVTTAAKLPFVHLGLARDLWAEFDRYAHLEKGLRSSFFVIPFRNCPGRTGQGQAPMKRAAGYGAADITVQIRNLLSAGCEIGAHGIDAWLDSTSGRAELEEIRRITGSTEVGVRMHWLYFDEHSPVTLENAGADYDSTVGYNGTVGFRAGTTQAYKPLGATRLLELPLHIMDTALFYPAHLNLSPDEAQKRVGEIIDNAVQFGGCVTINWHDRSIAPERCWGDFYLEMVDELQRKGAWFATAAEVVSWFRKRRSATFEKAGVGSDVPSMKTAIVAEDLPNLHFRIHNLRQTPTISCNS
jgi:hypothetical protein